MPALMRGGRHDDDLRIPHIIYSSAALQRKNLHNYETKDCKCEMSYLVHQILMSFNIYSITALHKQNMHKYSKTKDCKCEMSYLEYQINF